MQRLFKGRKLLIATKHGKERAIAPVLEQQLGVQCFVYQGFDTDTLGTFTGEVERQFDPLTTARKKCLRAMELADCDLAVASEGSFGPHPSIYFIPADEEILYFIDRKNNVEIYVFELSTDTNFSSSTISSWDQLQEFARKAGFPSHGLMIRKSKDEVASIVKGITNIQVLEASFRKMMTQFGSVYVETDMRAMFNPQRMQVIEKAAQRLADKINTLCPICGMPGFGISSVIQGLPCRTCGFPTKGISGYEYLCTHCSHKTIVPADEDNQTADPQYCDNCNP